MSATAGPGRGSARRSHTCGELRAEDEGKRVRLTGWIHRNRDQGGLVFFDLRDRYGLTQVTCNAESADAETMTRAGRLRSEFVVAVEGTVVTRPADMRNDDLATGAVEVVADRLEILNESKVLPFVLDDEPSASEDLRLEYRFLDLRRHQLLRVLELRNRVCQATRRYLDEFDFLEVETPMLVRPTPEGARDYLVPSRVRPGHFYALPQSPQLYKQLLMVSGFDRYYQIARCMRDEDLRADRQPEFSQIDLEMSFIDEEVIYELLEGLMAAVVKEAVGRDLATPFARLSFADAMNRYGSDKPDVRFAHELCDVSDALRGTEFRAFSGALNSDGVVKALVIPASYELSRKDIDGLEEVAKRYGAKGLARAKVAESGLESGVAKFLSETEQRAVVDAVGGEVGDVVVMVADRWVVACNALGSVRLEFGKRNLDLDPDELSFVWVNDFTLFEVDPGSGTLAPSHHIFTMPREDDLEFLDSDPTRVRGQLYDLVLNGVELGSGSIRVHRRDLQERLLRRIGMSTEEAERRFGFLLNALEYGAPPHGGIALGLERIIMILAKRTNIRDTIAFPKTTSAASLMDGSPARVSPEELFDLHLEMKMPAGATTGESER